MSIKDKKYIKIIVFVVCAVLILWLFGWWAGWWAGKNAVIGDIGPSGGYIFYDKGSYSNGWRYLEAAPAVNEYTSIVWGGFGRTVGGTGIAIGTGKSNTERIVAKFGDVEPYEKRADYAAKLCADLVVTKDGVTYDDWFLPSKDELDLMYENLWRKGSFADSHRYWSSSELNDSTAYQRTFIRGESMPFEIRYTECNVRPVRAF